MFNNNYLTYVLKSSQNLINIFKMEVVYYYFNIQLIICHIICTVISLLINNDTNTI
jgi:hypothetical protein